MSQFDHAEQAPLSVLTPQQREIVDLVAEGLTNQEIADRIGLSRPGVAVEILGLLNALKLPNRLRLAIWFLRQAG